MYNRQTKDNKKWCDLANLTNVYNSDNIKRSLQRVNLNEFLTVYKFSDVYDCV